MAERFVSPGVFTRENDLSFLPQGIAEIGAAFIGPTVEGPAFRPVIIESQEEFKSIFGTTTSDFYTPYAVRSYLTEASRATVVRILGLDGYSPSTYKSIRLTLSGSVGGGEFTIAVIHPSRTGITLPTASISASSSPIEFGLALSGSTGYTLFTSMSIDPTSTRYFAKVLGTGVTTAKDGYVYASFPDAASFVSGALQGSGSIKVYTYTTNPDELKLTGSFFGTYRNARTPMIRSQVIGATRHDLFRFYTLSDGNSANTKIKVSITSLKADPLGVDYGTFSVIVREFDDTDGQPTVLEQFDGMTLDPTSVNYVAKRIGTARTVIDANGNAYLDGDFPNRSKHIYIEMAAGAEEFPIDALPYGFAALAAPVSASNVPAPLYVRTRYAIPTGASTAVADNKVYYGFDFDEETSLSYLMPTPDGTVNTSFTALIVGQSGSAADTGFDLNTSTATTDASDIATTANYAIRKFTIPFQGGFDGQNPAVNRYTGASITATNTMGFDLSDSNRDGARAYKQALDAIKDPDSWDINLLVMPGVIYDQHQYIAQYAMDMVADRGDAFFIMDPDTLGASVSDVTTAVESLDTNYTGVYHPWVKILDEESNKNIWVPPSVVMVGVFAFNDKVAAEWYAPAGLNRGGISDALQVRTRLNRTNRDDLYEGRVNPIAQFPEQGIVTWGQKTLQIKASALDRINVRRLLIAVKKFIASTSRYLVFEQNVESTRQKFLSIVNPYLSSVQERNGLYAFKVVMDDSNNTPDIIDRNILVGELFLQPTRTAEFISLTFNVLPTGATFPE